MKLAFRSDIGLANAKVSMEFVMNAIGMPDVSYAASGAKVDCPFMSVFHPDSGKSFRVYDNTGAYCFACSERYNPVKIYALAKDISQDAAAEDLLELVGYRAPDADERIATALEDTAKVDRDSLSLALKTYCSRVDPNWDIDQFEDAPSNMLRKCLDLLTHVRSAEQTHKWLEASKIAMNRVLTEGRPS